MTTQTAYRLGALLLIVMSASALLLAQHGVRTQDIAFESRGVTLQGTLRNPAGPGPHAAIVTVHGSGRIGRDDRFQRQIAEHFPTKGVAVFSYAWSSGSASGWESAYPDAAPKTPLPA